MTVTSVFRAITSVIILCGLSIGGEHVSNALHLPVPGPILGMITLLALLAAFPRLHAWVAPAADVLLRWLGALIVPAAAGIVLYGDVFKDHGLALAAVLVVTTLMTGLSIALIYRATAR
jgi:holin-like protein